jgi:glutathione S-transferase
MNASQLPILYSFRRCPYAMRARFAITISEVQVETREVILSNKPKELLDCSPKATVPVLQLPDKTVIDESRDIMLWALKQQDPQNWLSFNTIDTQEINRLIDFNDNKFKQHLDQYKYASRFPDKKMETYRQQGEVFLQLLEEKLNKTNYLISNTVSLADMAILPFIKQFAYVDKDWFDQTEYEKLQVWLSHLLDAPLFQKIMKKQPAWVSESNVNT